jgi:hypothetical protein
MKHFNIATDQGRVQVFAEPITIGKFQCFIHEGAGKNQVIITEYYSGMQIVSMVLDSLLISPVTEARKLLESTDEQTIIKHCRGILQHNGLSYPLNK